MARFDLINPMSTSETDSTKDLVLFNNPNNGNFSLQGSILQKEFCSVHIYDASGRMVFSSQLSKNKVQHFGLEHRLAKGNYLVKVKGGSKQQLKVFKMTVSE